MLQALFRKACNFAHRPLFDRAWFIPAWLLLGASRALILVIPFRTLVPYLGCHSGALPWVPIVDANDEATARSIARVVQMTAKYTPWTSNCFPQAITVRILLGLYRIPYCLFLGVSNEPGMVTMQAHAWVVAGRVAVSGGESFGRYTVVGCFFTLNPKDTDEQQGRLSR